MRKTLPLLCALSLVAASAGCSNDVAPNSAQAPSLIRGQIAGSAFQVKIAATGDASHPVQGPFVLSGSNPRYDAQLRGRVVDWRVCNQGQVVHREPVGLTFLSFDPSAVTVRDPDRGMFGGSTAIAFHFANHDGKWTPGESSLPRTVTLGASRGMAIGFVA